MVSVGVGVAFVLVALPSVMGSLVPPDAEVYVTNLNAEGAPNKVQPRDVTAVLLPVRDHPGGEVELLTRLTIKNHNGTGEPVVMENAFDLSIPAPEDRDRYPVLAEPRFEWDPPAGMYRLTMQVFERGDTGLVFWSEGTTLHRVGTGPNLREGWGHVSGEAPSLDLLGDEKTDVRMLNATGEENAWTARVTAQPWDNNHLHGWEVRLVTHPPEAGEDMSLQLSEDALRAVLQAGDDDQLRFSWDDEYTRGNAPEGWIGFDVSSPRGGYHSLRVFTEIEGPAPLIWFDGYRNRVNLTGWDVTGNGEEELRFWESTTETVDEASKAEAADRREEPVQMLATLKIDDGGEGYALILDLERADRRGGPVWLEMNESAVLETVPLETESDVSVSYNLSLPPGEGLVQKHEGSVWVWFGHFSMQRLEISVLEDATQGTNDEASSGAEGATERNEDGVRGRGPGDGGERLVSVPPVLSIVAGVVGGLMARRT